jgi:DNA-directed RNA polymerase specialized sigma24 family protein
MGAGAASRTGGSEFRIIDALNAEWVQLSGGDASAVHRWGLRHPALRDCLDAEGVLRAVRQDPDPVLFALLSECSDGDLFAGRVVLQAMLGKIVRLAVRDRQVTADEYVAAMWCRIRTYPLQARPDKIAPNLALDTLKMVTREKRWGGEVEVATVPHEDFLELIQARATERAVLDHNAEVGSLSARGVIAAAAQLGIINAQTRDVLLTVYAEGVPGRAAAEQHQTSAGMIRFRCSKAVRRMAQHASALAEAA